MDNKPEMAFSLYNSASPTEEEDDYIDMEVSSYNSSSINPRREFEFQMFGTTKSQSQKESSITSPADELFYKGKLLPLHLPPRLQMLEKLLQNSSISIFDYKSNETFDAFSDLFGTPLATSTAPSTTTCTPFESCNISPSDSRQVSGVINPDDYLLQFSKNVNVLFEEGLKKSWTTSFGSKIKASRTYLKSLFSAKNGCKAVDCSVFPAKGKSQVKSDQKAKTCSITYKKIANEKTPFEKNGLRHEITTSSNNEGKKFVKGASTYRMSFSGAIKRHSTIKSSSSLDSSCSSASSSNNSNGFCDLQSLKKSIGSGLEVENSIQSAITHCKESQQPQGQRNCVRSH